MNKLNKQSHKRLNILTHEWVLVSPHRTKRPWQGKQEKQPASQSMSYDPTCYLCPGNMRSNGQKNPDYESVFVFDNDFPAINTTANSQSYSKGLLQAVPEQGICRVVCFSPNHSKSLAHMSVEDIASVVREWKRQYAELGDLDHINYVQIFENKGEIMGCSNSHPHGQIWSQSSIPNEVLKKDYNQRSYYEQHQTSILLDYLKQELELDERIIYENTDFVVLVPFWAVWPYETMIIPKRAIPDVNALSLDEEKSFADAISVTTSTYDRIFDCSFPYSAGIHQAPTNGSNKKHWQLHMSFYPPLLRSASVKKFMVGYEMFGMPQRDVAPEQVAEQLRILINR